MKLILLTEEQYDDVKFQLGDNIKEVPEFIADIKKDGVNIEKSKITRTGPVPPDKLIKIVVETIFKNVGFIEEPKEGIQHIGKCGRFDVYKDVSQPKFQTSNYTKDTPTNSVGYEDPELSNAYQDAKIWCIAYDTGFKTIELLETGVYITKQKAEDAAKEMSDTDMFRGTELTVIGIPIKNIDYGDTFFVPGDEEDELVEISDELFLELAKQAHKQNVTVNELANTLLRAYIDSDLSKEKLSTDEDFK